MVVSILDSRKMLDIQQSARARCTFEDTSSEWACKDDSLCS